MSTQHLSRRGFLATTAIVAAAPGLALAAADPYANSPFRKVSDGDWEKRLPRASYEVLRHEDTEPPWSDKTMLNEHRKGVFACAGCSLDLFASETKFESGTGWPSFYKPLANAVITRADHSYGMERTEVLCRRCGGHLGHVFDDGPKPTGLRYCMNGLALTFRTV